MKYRISVWLVGLCMLSACQVLAGTAPLSIEADLKTAGSGGMPAAGAGTGGTAGKLLDAGPVDAGPLDAAPLDAAPDAYPPCAKPEGSECSWIESCGCDEPEHCQARGAEAKGTCVKPGKHKLGEVCGSPDECADGTCEQRVCRAYCSGECGDGKCLPATGEGDKPLEKVNVCWKSCQVGSDSCPDGTTCQTRDLNGTKAAFCMPPANPCPTTEDGKCDEPVTCAAGTDSVDCSCVKKEGAECNPGAQCGCPKGKSCEISSSGFQPVCAVRSVPGVAVGGMCESSQSCAAGLTCLGNELAHSCREYCNTNADCSGDGDECKQVLDDKGADIPGYKYCSIACSESRTCPSNHSCVKGETGSFCIPFAPEIPGSECSLTWQLGCDSMADTACQLDWSSSTASATCQPHAGKRPVDSSCTNDSDCQRGSTCHWGVCRHFCDPRTATRDDPADGCTANGLCVAPPLTQGEAPFNLCMLHCSSDSDCEAGLQCGRYPEFATGGICIAPLTGECPVNDGECDEPMPRGTGICAPGFDTADCMVSP